MNLRAKETARPKFRIKDYFKKATEKIQGHLLMARPYSWMDYPATVLLAKVQVTRSLELGAVDGANLVATLLLWFSLNWRLEAEHNHAHRPKIDKFASEGAFAGAVFIGAAVNPLSIIPAGLQYETSVLYSKKEGENKFLNATSFLIRGIGHGLVYLFSTLFYTSTITLTNVITGLALGAICASRNLIGDLRDIKYDERTFPKMFGEKTAKIVASGLKVSAAVGLYLVTGSALVGLPLLVEAGLTLLYKNNQQLHRISGIGTVATMANAILATMGMFEGILLSNLVYGAGLVNLIFYNKIERRSNGDYE